MIANCPFAGKIILVDPVVEVKAYKCIEDDLLDFVSDEESHQHGLEEIRRPGFDFEGRILVQLAELSDCQMFGKDISELVSSSMSMDQQLFPQKFG